MELKKTLLMPKTNFEMRGNLTKKEPGLLDKFISNRVYYLALEKNCNVLATDINENALDNAIESIFNSSKSK